MVGVVFCQRIELLLDAFNQGFLIGVLEVKLDCEAGLNIVIEPAHREVRAADD